MWAKRLTFFANSDSMKILLANKFYYRRGGDCIYMLNLEQLLKAHGHEVAVFAMDYPENLDTPWKKYFPKTMSKVKAFTRPFGDGETKRKFSQLLDDFQPDVVHLNNIHTQLSPVIAELAHGYGCRVVWTLHDYKLLCPRYDCLREISGKLANCELCFNGNKKACLDYKCMKGSKLASFIGYREAEKWNRERLEKATDVFVCPSQFMADKMVQGGFEKRKMKTICNFIDVEKCRFSNTDCTEYTDFSLTTNLTNKTNDLKAPTEITETTESSFLTTNLTNKTNIDSSFSNTERTENTEGRLFGDGSSNTNCTNNTKQRSAAEGNCKSLAVGKSKANKANAVQDDAEKIRSIREIRGSSKNDMRGSSEDNMRGMLYQPKKGEYYCFIGRLSHEKGARTLIEAANQLPYKLVVIGGGPLMDELKAVANDNVEFVGFKQWDDIKQLVGKARFSVIPSEWYENNPLSVIEAQCLGTPVLGANIGGIPELTEYTFESGNVEDLKEKIEGMWNATFDYNKLASESMARYDAESYYRQIMEVYKK